VISSVLTDESSWLSQWGRGGMLIAGAKDREGWAQRMALDPVTGLDPSPSVRIRAERFVKHGMTVTNAAIASMVHALESAGGLSIDDGTLVSDRATLSCLCSMHVKT
jgi:hypothetical protein